MSLEEGSDYSLPSAGWGDHAHSKSLMQGHGRIIITIDLTGKPRMYVRDILANKLLYVDKLIAS